MIYCAPFHSCEFAFYCVTILMCSCILFAGAQSVTVGVACSLPQQNRGMVRAINDGCLPTYLFIYLSIYIYTLYILYTYVYMYIYI